MAHVKCPSCGFEYQLEVRRGAPRSFGPRSQSARFHGHCQDIAVQSKEYTAPQVKEMLKWHAAAEGLWRTVTDFWGNRHPISESLASIEEEANLIRLQQMLADSKGWWLVEYIDPAKPKLGTYKSIGGRSYSEMLSYKP